VILADIFQPTMNLRQGPRQKAASRCNEITPSNKTGTWAKAERRCIKCQRIRA